MNIVALDLGFNSTKAIVNGKRVKTKSLIGEGKNLRFSDLALGKSEGKDHIQCVDNGQKYFVSDLAIQESNYIDHSLNGDRFNSDATKILIQTALGLGLGTNSIDAYAVSGLPVNHYAIYKDDIRSLFLGSGTKTHYYDITENNKFNHKGSVRFTGGSFIPQPFGALMNMVLDDNGRTANKELASSTVAIADIGFGTTDIYTVDALTPVDRLSFSTSTAMNHAYTLIGEAINNVYSVDLPFYKIEEIALTGRYKKNGATYDMSPVIKSAYKATARQIMTELDNKWKDSSSIDQILLTGGGSIALSEYILPNYTNMSVMPDSQWSVAEGYYKWGIRNNA